MSQSESELLTAAVLENAEWCDLVCRAHGLSTRMDARTWRSERRPPPYYPDAVTLDPLVSAETILAGLDLSAGCSIKDSYATLDLGEHGFEVLFAAEWIQRPVAPPQHPSSWSPTPSPYPGALVFSGENGRVDAHPSAGVVGLSNLSGPWHEAVSAISAAFPGRPIVGYERGAELTAALAAGFEAMGPLRVWVNRGDAGSSASRAR